MSTVHACPPTGEALTPCCHRPPFELGVDERLTLDPALVTCTPAPPPPVRRHLTLSEMQGLVVEVNQALGWFDEPRTFGDMIALLHSEASEALEAYRKHGLDDATGPDMHIRTAEHLGDPTTERATLELAKPEGVGSEFADVLIRLLDACHRYDIDLEAEFERKLAYNRTRPYRHGGRKL